MAALAPEVVNEFVSIPFRAVTGFEHAYAVLGALLIFLFQSLSGLSLGLNHTGDVGHPGSPDEFQSLSGLSLGLNVALQAQATLVAGVSIPFRAVTGFEHRRAEVAGVA